jgi:hypothetical protein
MRSPIGSLAHKIPDLLCVRRDVRAYGKLERGNPEFFLGRGLAPQLASGIDLAGGRLCGGGGCASGKFRPRRQTGDACGPERDGPSP